MATEGTPIAPEGVTTKPEAEKFLGEYVKQELLLVLIHIPTRNSTSSHQPLKNARAWAEHAVAAYNQVRESKGEEAAPVSDFIVVEIRKSGTVRTTTLEKYEEPKDEVTDSAEAAE